MIVSPPQVFSLLKSKGIEIKDVEMLQALVARNTYDLKFRSDEARVKGVSALKGIEGLTVTPYDRSLVVTVLYLNYEVDQSLVARVLSQYGTVSDMWRCTYGTEELKGVFNGRRQFRMVLKRDIPSFLFIGGCKAHTRYLGQPRTCFRCGQEGHEARGCPNKRCGRCLQLGHDQAECPNQVVCNLCGEEGHLSRACPTSYSARVSGDVGKAPEPSSPGPEPLVEEPTSPSHEELEEVAREVEEEFLAKLCQESGTPVADTPTPPGEDVMTVVEGDLRLSSDSESGSEMSSAEPAGPVSEPPPREPPPGTDWFDSIEGHPDSLKRPASMEGLSQATTHPDAQTSNHRKSLKTLPQSTAV